MSLNVAKSILCGLVIAQASIAAAAVSLPAQKIADAELAKCEAVKADWKAFTSCVVEANTKVIARLQTSESKLMSAYAACGTKFKGIKGAAPLVKWCASEASTRSSHSVVSKAAIEEQLAYQATIAEYVSTKLTENSINNIKETVTTQVQSAYQMAEAVVASEEQYRLTMQSLRSNYKAATGKKF